MNLKLIDYRNKNKKNVLLIWVIYESERDARFQYNESV